MCDLLIIRSVPFGCLAEVIYLLIRHVYILYKTEEIFFNLSFLSSYTLLSNSCISLAFPMQTLRETIHQEYREVVERRIFTGQL